MMNHVGRQTRLLAALVLIGCGSSTEPLSGDIYVLQSIAGFSLPASYHYDPGTVAKIYSDTLAFGANGRGERRTVYDSFQGTKRSETVLFSYTKAGERIEIALDCPDMASCIAPPHFAGSLTNTTLTFSESKVARVPFVYARHFGPD